MICVWHYCGAEVKPLRGQERITSRTVFVCPECRGRLPRYSQAKSNTTERKKR